MLPTPKSSAKVIDHKATQIAISHQQLVYGIKLGSGSFAKVYSGTYQNTDVAIKRLRKDRSLEGFNREVEVMVKLDSPYVVQMHGVCSESPNYAIVMEYMAGGALFDLLHDPNTVLEWDIRCRYGLDIAKGIVYLHSKNIVHCDLKSPNILLDATKQNIKIADFGLSKVKAIDSLLFSTAVGGSAPWMAPEIITSLVFPKYSEPADVYSFAMVLWEISARKKPYQIEGINLPQWVAEGNRETIPVETPLAMKELIQHCWKGEAQERPTMEQCVTKLENSVINTGFCLLKDVEPQSTKSPNASLLQVNENCKTGKDFEDVIARAEKAIAYYESKEILKEKAGLKKSDYIIIIPGEDGTSKTKNIGKNLIESAQEHIDAIENSITVVKEKVREVKKYEATGKSMKVSWLKVKNEPHKEINENIAWLESILIEKELKESKPKLSSEYKKRDELTEGIKNFLSKYRELEQQIKILKSDTIQNKDALKKLDEEIKAVDAELRMKKRERHIAKGGDDIDKTLLNLLDGTITGNSDAVKTFVDCANTDQVNSLAVFAIKNNKKELLDWIFNGVNKNFKDANNQSLLTLSAESADKFEIFSELLASEVDSDDYSHALYQCIDSQNEEGFNALWSKLVVSDYAAVDCYGTYGKGRDLSGLMCAVMHKLKTMWEKLIPALKANKEAINYQFTQISEYQYIEYCGETALYMAAKHGYLGVCTLLINVPDIDVNFSKNHKGGKSSPLEIAAEKGHKDIVEILKNKSKDKSKLVFCHLVHAIITKNMTEFNKYIGLINTSIINDKDSEGYTLLHRAVMANNQEVCELLLQQGANIHEVATNTHHRTSPLFNAVSYYWKYKSDDMCKFLLTKGAHADCTNLDGQSVLIQAAGAYTSSLPICNLLIAALLASEKKQHINHLWKEKPALYWAAERGNEDVCKALLATGAHTQLPPQLFGQCLEIAAQHGHLKVIEMLKTAGAKSESTNLYLAFNAIEKKNLSEFEAILDGGLSDINAKDNIGNTLLHTTAKKIGSDDICKLLVKQEDIKINEPYGNGGTTYLTPLFESISYKNWSVCEILLRHNASANCFDNEGESALIKAINRKCSVSICEKIIAVLKKEGKAAVINSQYNGKTALYYAAEKGMDEVCYLLIKDGADITLSFTNQFGAVTSPLSIAIQSGLKKTAELLQQKEREMATVSATGTKIHIFTPGGY